MGIFGNKQLNYSYGRGLLPKLKSNSYIKHSLPGEISHFQLAQLLDFRLMQQEALNGKTEELLNAGSEFVRHLEYDDANFDYNQNNIHQKLADISPPDIQDNPMAYLANIVKKSIDNQKEIHSEFMPFLKEFENRLELKFTTEQKRTIMRLFRFGMFLSLVENQSGLNVQGSYHPTILNCLAAQKSVLHNLEKHKINTDLEFAQTNERKMDIVSLALSVGYFHSKYSLESPKAVMEFVK